MVWTPQADTSTVWTPSQNTTVSAMVPAFNFFAKLPKELQLMIWKFALPGARTLKITSKGITLGGAHRELLKAESTIPATLHACCESRRVALKKYKLFFLEHPGLMPQYLNMSCDTLYVMNVRALEALVGPAYESKKGEQSLREQLKHLMLGEDFTEPYRWDALGYFLVRCFSGLKTLTLEYDFTAPAYSSSSDCSSAEDSEAETDIEDEDEEGAEDLMSKLMDKHYDARGAIWGSRPAGDSLPYLEWMTANEMNWRFLNEREGNPLVEQYRH